MPFLKKTSLIRKTIYSCVLLGIITLISAFGLYYSVALGIACEMPSENDLINIKNYQASDILAKDGELLGRYFVENRSSVDYSNISPFIVNALVATEDVRFWKHQGIDQRSLFRVLFKSIILQQANAGGGSTLSQQLIKNVFGRKSYGLLTMPITKIKESILANKLNHLYTKEEIITLYLNTVSFGEDTYGIETACERFFNTTPDKVTLEEAALLIGLLKAPTAYNPRLHPDKSLKRRNTVLSQMVKYNYLIKADYTHTKRLPINLDYQRKSQNEGIAAYFRTYIKDEIQTYLNSNTAKLGKQYDVNTDGLKIYTTINYTLQLEAEKALNTHLYKLTTQLRRELSNELKKSNYKSLLTGEIHKSNRYQKLLKAGLEENAILKQLDQPNSTRIFTFEGLTDTIISPIDSIIHYITFLQGAYLAKAPKSGALLTWVGGLNHKFFPYDHVLSKRQIGSTFKPFVYALALEKGRTICDKIKNEQVIYSQFDDWSPKNSGGKYEGKFSLIGALTNSVNTISVKLLMENGINEQVNFCNNMGLKDSLPRFPSLALGVADIPLKSLIEAYTPFANHGQSSPLYYIEKITTADNQILFEHNTEEHQQITSDQLAQKTTQMLQSVVKYGTGKRLSNVYDITFPIAGKTGTTQNHADGWFIGYTDSILAGVWVGADNPSIRFKSIRDGQGANMALPIWAETFKSYYDINNPTSDTLNLDCELYYPEKTDFIHQLFKRHKPKTNTSNGLKGKKGKKKKSFFRRKE